MTAAVDGGLTSREAARRLLQHGPNALPEPQRPSVWAELGGQVAHPLALVLWLAAALATVTAAYPLAAAVVAVIVLNAAFALAQEHQAERAVEALASYLPEQAAVIRDGRRAVVAAQDLVPGDLLLVEEGERVSADAQVVAGAVEVDMSSLTGESVPVARSATPAGDQSPLQRPDRVFSGSLCTSGSAHAVVLATGAQTEIGRIAALSGRTERETSPLEQQITKVAWLIARVGVLVGLAFVPLGLLAGLSPRDAGLFAIGLLVANVPEGLLPTITLALAVGVRVLARRGAVVKRLSAVETLGCTTVICTDKTGTLTQNRMSGRALWTEASGQVAIAPSAAPDVVLLVRTAAECTQLEAGESAGHDPTELAVAALVAGVLGDIDVPAATAVHPFDPHRKLVSAVVAEPGGWRVAVKGAPESVLARCRGDLQGTAEAVERMARDGLRVLAVARREGEGSVPDRDGCERELELVGLLALQDPPREHVPAAVAACHEAGIRIVVVTGDHPATAEHIAREVGIGSTGLRLLDGPSLDRLCESELDAVLHGREEVVISRSTPETKLSVAESLRRAGEVVAMTGDGVNDAPALRRADIGVAMGLSGTDVAREAATLVLTDDDFATIPRAIEAGRQVYDDVRKFVLYIFAHAVPEIVPFLVFALSGGAVPLPLTVLQILAIDLGTETLPALALGREAAEPGVMTRPPRPRSEGVVTRELLLRAWLLLGVVSAALVMSGFFAVLLRGGWHLGAATGDGTALHGTYVRATTLTFVGIVACQVGTAFAARTDRVSLRTVGVGTNRLLLGGIVFELVFTAAVVYLSPLQRVFGTASLGWSDLALVVPFPFVVWGVDELRKARRRKGAGR